MKKQLEKEYEEIVKEIIEHPEFQKRKKYAHHGDITVYDHCLKVSKKAYSLARFFHTDYKSAAIAGLLHDFYEKPWQDDPEKHKFFEQHGFTHAKNAKDNARQYFAKYMTPEIENAILRHMFPLNIKPPRYKVGWIVTLADKIVSLEVFKYPKKLLMLVGVKSKKSKGSRL